MLLNYRIIVEITKIAFCDWGSATDSVKVRATAIAIYCPLRLNSSYATVALPSRLAGVT